MRICYPDYKNCTTNLVNSILKEFLAIAVSDLLIYNSREEMEMFIGVHAGLTEDEMVVPLVAVECNLA